MVNLSIDIPASFFLEEERNGHLVSARVKELWAVQLDLLHEFDRVCKKYNLKYILDYGTLLGAIRHKGYIPWDDDVDVSMLREDYEKLAEIAPQEFKEPYFFQNPYTDKNYDEAIPKLRRSDTMYLAEHNLKHSPDCNMGIFIDIFVFDNVPADSESDKLISQRTQSDFLHRYVLCHRPSLFDGEKKYPARILRYLYYKLRYGSTKKIFSKQEQFAQSFKQDGTVGCIMYFALDKRARSMYIDTMRVPFENMMLPIPTNYDELLRILYGDYMTPVKDGACHTIASFDTSRSYKEILGKHKKWQQKVD